jgi:predicted membrane chloride channel (bestrophin family)
LSFSTVWLYLFFLPFQLVNQFGYYTIAGTAMAAFIYLGFVAAGEEIEQPFGTSVFNFVQDPELTVPPFPRL